MMFKELKQEGKTIIFTTHNPNQVLDLDCNVIVLNDKSVMAQGPASKIVDDQLLEKIYKGKVSKTSSHYTFSE